MHIRISTFLAIKRVAGRVEQGGHHIPEDTIRSNRLVYSHRSAIGDQGRWKNQRDKIKIRERGLLKSAVAAPYDGMPVLKLTLSMDMAFSSISQLFVLSLCYRRFFERSGTVFLLLS